MTSAVPIVNLASMYMNGLRISSNATTPDEKLDVALGQCRDSTNVYDMSLSAAITLNIASNGLNGLDTGTVAADKLYAIHLISDPVSGNATGGLISLSVTAPTMPNGYSAFRHIGYATTDGDADLLLGYWTGGNSGNRKFLYDAPQATAITAGNATSFTAVALTKWVPAVENTPVSIAYAFTPGAASRALNLTPGNGTGSAVTITGQVTSVVVSGNAEVLARVTSSVPEVDYKVANSGDAVALNVAGYSVAL